jgi:hypothetical protein
VACFISASRTVIRVGPDGAVPHAGCFEQEPITQNHSALSRPVDIEDNRHQWLRGAIIEALQRVENFKLRNWSQNDTLGAHVGPWW